MKRVRHILALILALVTIYFGAGVAFVHICSAYCHSQKHCSSHTEPADETPVRTEKLCCHIQSQSSCDCLDITFQIDFFHQLSQKALSVVAQWAVGLPLQLAVPSPAERELCLLSRVPNPPPVWSGRTLLALHSILII